MIGSVGYKPRIVRFGISISIPSLAPIPESGMSDIMRGSMSAADEDITLEMLAEGGGHCGQSIRA